MDRRSQKERDDKIVVLRCNELRPVADIAQLVGLSESRVREILRSRGVVAPKQRARERRIRRREPDPRAKEMARLYAEEFLSLKQVGEHFGLTRERVRQILYQEGIRGDVVLRRRREQREAEREAEKAAELAEAERVAAPCVVCAKPNIRAVLSPHLNYRTCSTECAKAWVILRYRLDPEVSRRHRVIQAHSILRHPERYRPSLVSWAKRIVTEGPENVPRDRSGWVVSGSSTDLLTRKFGIARPTASEPREGARFTCGQMKKDGTACQHPVSTPGGLCGWHSAHAKKRKSS